jgi:serpin B
MWISHCLLGIITAGLLLAFGTALAPGAPAGENQRLVEGNTTFALDLYGRLKSSPKNVFFSPYSISTCLAMTYGGARGDTAKQMAEVLHFGPKAAQVHSAFASLQRGLNEIGGQGSNQFNIANALWAQQGHAFLPAFLTIARDEYQANVNQADFKTAAESARSKINQWVAQKTQERIKDILPPGSVDAMTRLVLANAIYFKGAWAAQFRAAETRPQPFHVSAGSQVQVPMMHQSENVRYAEDDSLQAVEMPYSGNGLSMVVLLPRRIDGCPDLEKRLTPSLLSQSLAQMKQQKVEIFLPKFKMDSSFELNGPLAKMGMADAFGPKADFSGMDGTRQLYISGVFHKAWVEVNEQGTEAAAATATTMRALSIARPLTPPPVFRADHPFIFLIRDMRSGSILFLGRLAQPPSSSE